MYHRHFHKAHFDENNYMSWRRFALDLIANPSNNVEVSAVLYCIILPVDLMTSPSLSWTS